MNKTIISILLLLLASCSKDKEYYVIPPGPDGKPIEHPGQITIPDDAGLPDGSTINIIDEDGNTVDAKPGQSVDLEAGQYKIVVTENSTGVTVSGTTATLPASGDGSVALAPALLADVVTVTVYEGRVTVPAISLKPMTREVQLRINISGITPGNISGVKATLHGVANTLNLAQGFGVVSGEHHVSAAMEGYASGGMLGLRVFGITPGFSPNMVIEVSTMGGAVHRLQQDVSQALSGFNSGSPAQPVLLNAALTIETDAEMEGTIKPWKPGWEGEITPSSTSSPSPHPSSPADTPGNR